MGKPSIFRSKVGDVFQSLLFLTAFCVFLSLLRIWLTDTHHLLFLVWNLFLAWVPLVAAWFLYIRTSHSGLVWSYGNIALFTIWLLFLPNAFYITTDFIHLRGYSGDFIRLFDIVLLMSYAVLGMIIGLLAVLLTHIRGVQRFGQVGHILPVVVLFMSGFAIYLGRYLRWNSWDVVVNPFGLLFDISDHIVHPTSHATTFATTLLYFSFCGLLYLFTWRIYRLVAIKQK